MSGLTLEPFVLNFCIFFATGLPLFKTFSQTIYPPKAVEQVVEPLSAHDRAKSYGSICEQYLGILHLNIKVLDGEPEHDF
jgi:hypothetical protein